MHLLIEEKQKRKIDEYLMLFCSLDEKQEELFSFISEERKTELLSLLKGHTQCQETGSRESIFAGIFRLIHPENLADKLLDESPVVNKIILNAIPQELSETVEFYFPPEVLSRIRAEQVSINCTDSILIVFANQIIQNFNRSMEIISKLENADLFSKLIILSYDEILSVLKSAGEFTLNQKERHPDIMPYRNEATFAGYTLLAALIAEEAYEVKSVILSKFSQNAQKIINTLLSEKQEKIKCLKQKSEEIFKRTLKMY